MLRLAPLVLLVACGGSPTTTTTATTPALPPSNHAAAGPPVALALVFAGGEVWVGNDALTPEGDPSRFLGALKGLEAAVDGADLVHSLPAGSVGTAIVYVESATVRVPMGAIDKLRGAALGTQKDYYYKQGTNLVAGIELAQLELDKTNATKKVLIVVGDGNDTDNHTAKARLATLQPQLAAANTTVFAIMYKGELSDPTNVITVLAPDARTVTSVTELPLALAKVLHDCCKP